MNELFGFLNHGKGREAKWNKTELAEDRVSESNPSNQRKKLGKEKNFQHRPIIGRNRKINGGVYLGEGAREAIVVDDKKDPNLEKVYQKLLFRRKQAQQRGRSFKDGILEDVWNLVKQEIQYNEKRVLRIQQDLPMPDSKIYLSAFFGGGVCRHQALLIGYLLERLSEEGLVGGKVSVDRNYVKDEGDHAWARYTNSVGVVFILDPALDYIGKLDDVIEKKDHWAYGRPEETNPNFRIASKVRGIFSGK